MRATTIELTPSERQVINNHIRFSCIESSRKQQTTLDRVRGKLIGARQPHGGGDICIEMTLEELGVLVTALNRCYPMGTRRTVDIFERARNNLRFQLQKALDDGRAADEARAEYEQIIRAIRKAGCEDG